MRCSGCGAENRGLGRFCSGCGAALVGEDGRPVGPLDGRYGSPEPEFGEDIEGPYVVWRWPYALWGTGLQTRKQYLAQSSLGWIAYGIVVAWATLIYGPIALGFMAVIAVVLAAFQYEFWLIGRRAAEEYEAEGLQR